MTTTEWINLKIEPAQHLIRIEIEGLLSPKGINYFPEGLPFDKDTEWMPNIPLNI